MKNCEGCRYWSEMIARIASDRVEAVCLAVHGKNAGHYTGEADACSAWEAGTHGAVRPAHAEGRRGARGLRRRGPMEWGPMKAIYAIVGMKHRGTEALVASLADETALTLIREPSNAYDRNAIQVWTVDPTAPKMIGFLSAKQNAKLAARMDAMRPDGKSELLGLPAKLQRVSGGWPMAEVEE